MIHHKSDKRIKCDKLVYNTSKHVVCSHCINSLHFKCSRLSKKYYLRYPQKTFFYTCQFCTNYKCIKYEKFVYYGRKGTLNNSQFELINNKRNDPCYCRPGKMICFLFSDFQIISSLKYIASKKLIKQKTSLNKQVTKKTYTQFLTKSTL